MIVCAGGDEIIAGAVPVGIGLVESTINLTRLALMNPPEFLLFVGTAGSYGAHPIGAIVESKSAAQIEGSFAMGQSYTPIDNLISSAPDVSRETIINSSNYITTDHEVAARLASYGLGLENMEFFAVMRVAQEFGIPAGGIFAVTNMCGPHAHEEFKTHQRGAIDALEKYLADRPGAVR